MDFKTINRIILRFLLALLLVFFGQNSLSAFTLGVDPVINGLSPMHGKPGSSLSILGVNLSEINVVYFPSALSTDSIAVVPEVVNDTVVFVYVPFDAASGPVRIKGTGMWASSPMDFTFDKLPQPITGFGADAESYTYGDPALTIVGINSGIPLQLSFKSVPSKGVVSIIGNTFALVGVGAATITGYQAANQNYELGIASKTLTVLPKPLVVKIDSFSRPYKQSNPIFTGTVIGLVKNETLNVVYYSDANVNSSVGDYIITATVTGKTASNYSITKQNGVLTIAKASQTVNIPIVSGFELTPSSTILTVRNITASSGLTVDLQVRGRASLEAFVNGVAVISFDTAGAVSLVGNQSGNVNYLAAPEAVRNFTVSSQAVVTNTLTGIAAFESINVKIYPNPSNGLFWVESDETLNVKIYTYQGTLIEQKTIAPFQKQTLFIEEKGYFIAIVQSRNGIKFIKLLVE